MAVITKKRVIGFITIIIAALAITLILESGVRIKVTGTSTTFSVLEGKKYVVSGTEYVNLYDKTKKLGLVSTEIYESIDENTKTITITRHSQFKKGRIRDTYTFDGTLKDKEYFPVFRTIEVFEAKGLTLRYEARNLLSPKVSGNTATAGRNMKLIWEGNPKVTLLTSTVRLEYPVSEDYQIHSVRLFDPVEIKTSPVNKEFYISDTGAKLEKDSTNKTMTVTGQKKGTFRIESSTPFKILDEKAGEWGYDKGGNESIYGEALFIMGDNVCQGTPSQVLYDLKRIPTGAVHDCIYYPQANRTELYIETYNATFQYSVTVNDSKTGKESNITVTDGNLRTRGVVKFNAGYDPTPTIVQTNLTIYIPFNHTTGRDAFDYAGPINQSMRSSNNVNFQFKLDEGKYRGYINKTYPGGTNIQDIINKTGLARSADFPLSMCIVYKSIYLNETHNNIFMARDAVGGDLMYLGLTRIGQLTYSRLDAGNEINSTHIPGNDTYQHVCISQDSVLDKTYIYLNGTLIHEAQNTGNPVNANTPSTFLFSSNADHLKRFDGYISDFRYWNGYAVTQSDAMKVYYSDFGVEFLNWTTNAKIFNNTKDSDYLELAHTNYSETENIGVDTTGLVGLWHLNNDSRYDESNTKIYDFSQAGNNGSCSTCPVLNRSGKIGNNYVFGSTESWNVGSNASLDALDPLTICTWAKPSSIPGGSRHSILSKGSSSLYLGTEGADVSNSFTFRVSRASSGAQATAAGGTMKLNEWNFLCANFTLDSPPWLYHNGIAVTSYSSQQAGSGVRSSDAAADMVIGGSAYGQEYQGLIDEVMVWNRILTPSEIATIYEVQRGNYPSNGSYQSQVFDAGTNVSWTNITFQKAHLKNSYGGVKVRACDDAQCDGEAWRGDGSTDDYFSSSYTKLNTTITPNYRYFQYMVVMGTTNRTQSPTFANVMVGNSSIGEAGDTTAPTVTLNFPANASSFTTLAWINFSANISDNIMLKNASLFINSTFNQSLSLSVLSTIANFSGNFTTGFYNWYIEAYDNSSNRGVSQTRIFTVASADQCTYGGSGPFTPPCDCILSSHINLGGNPMIVTQAGGSNRIEIRANITNMGRIEVRANSCEVACYAPAICPFVP